MKKVYRGKKEVKNSKQLNTDILDLPISMSIEHPHCSIISLVYISTFKEIYLNLEKNDSSNGKRCRKNHLFHETWKYGLIL